MGLRSVVTKAEYRVGTNGNLSYGCEIDGSFKRLHSAIAALTARGFDFIENAAPVVSVLESSAMAAHLVSHFPVATGPC